MALENYTTYSEYDASGLVTVGANTLAVAGNNKIAFSVHKVFAAGHFSGDFEHVVAVALNDDSSVNYAWCPFWGLSNETAESAHSFKQIKAASGDCLYIAQYEASGVVWIRLFEISTGTEYMDGYNSASYDTWYYCEIERDESTGTYGTLLCRIYSDESRTSLVDTLSVTLHEKEDFSTVYAVSSFYNNSGRAYSQEIKNLDLQESGTIKSYSVAAGDDDGHLYNGSLRTSGEILQIGVENEDDTYANWHSMFFRFTGVAIPAGATIEAASVTLVSAGGRYDYAAGKTGYLKGRKVANCPAMSEAAYKDTVTYPYTTANVAWYPTSTNWVAGTSYTSPELKTVVQEIVDLAGWTSGNAIQIEWHYSGPEKIEVYNGNYRKVYAYDHATYNPPILNVEYTGGVAGGNPWWYYRRKRMAI